MNSLKLFIPLMAAALVSCGQRHIVYPTPKQLVVAEPVANVRAKPVRHNGTYEFDPLQETQLEQGEPVYVHEKYEEWVRISAPEQLEYTHNNKWEGYPGWVLQDALVADMGMVHSLSKKNIPEDDLRKNILTHARKHVGNPYLWGGRSLHDPTKPTVATGVDCSGLVNWSFRQEGWFIPRDSMEQYMRAIPIEPNDLKPADLIFLAKRENPEKIIHVAFYAGDGMLIEAPFSGENVREISIQERLGKSLKELSNGTKTNAYVVYFGSYFGGGK